MTHEAIEQREGLKPCPFCGTERIRLTAIRDGYEAHCRCGASVNAYNPNSRTKAITAWNTRHQSTTSLEEERDALAKRVEELEAALTLLATSPAPPSTRTPAMRDATPKEQAVNEMVRLLAPVLTQGQGMAARDREDRFRAAVKTLMDPSHAE